LGDNADDLILGVDLGSTKILTTVTNPQGKMLSRDHSITTAKKGRKAVIQSILESASHCEDFKNTMAKGGRVKVME
jgi:predicted NBD/HSP70 family sugar kinase